jgi:hypothetical protein
MNVEVSLQFPNYRWIAVLLFRAAQLTLITSASFLHTEPYGCNAGGLLAVLIWVG